jgi:uncharacterized membrane protein YgaE (UPF0421/DUF939 family)
MNKDIFCFEKITINKSLLDEIWTFDPRALDKMDGKDLSKYTIALAQYLVYYNVQKNKTKAEIYKLNKFIERTMSINITPEVHKKYKTKSAAADYLIATIPLLSEAQEKLDSFHYELNLIEGIDKSISELIATIKRELTRRENELYTVRMERRS